jgi:hypothetical protein
MVTTPASTITGTSRPPLTDTIFSMAAAEAWTFRYSTS